MRKGGEFAINLRDVAAAKWTHLTYRATRFSSLTLTNGDGRSLVIECRDEADRDSRVAFLSAVKAIALELQGSTPALQVDISGRPDWLKRLIGSGKSVSLSAFLDLLGGFPECPPVDAPEG